MIVDYTAKDANMYGCQPCPKCGSKYAYPHKEGGDTYKFCCDDCGHREPCTFCSEGES